VPLLSQPQNADGGELFGIEANLVKRITFLPAPCDGLGVSANLIYFDSSVTVPWREDEDIPFFRQSDWIAGGALFYENGPLEARLAVDYCDDYIVNIGSIASDIYNSSGSARRSASRSPLWRLYAAIRLLSEPGKRLRL